MSRTFRHHNGASISELPLVLIIIIFFGIVPILDLCTICLRVAAVSLACYEAAHAASAARTFEVSQPGYPSAKDTANQYVDLISKHVPGIIWVKAASGLAETDVVATELLSTSTTKVYTSHLPPPVRTKKYLYQYRVTVKAELPPVLPYTGPWFSNIPGFTGPMPLSCTVMAACECPSGLTQ